MLKLSFPFMRRRPEAPAADSPETLTPESNILRRAEPLLPANVVRSSGDDLTTILAEAFSARNAAQNETITVRAELLAARDQVQQLTTAAEGFKTQISALTSEAAELKTKLTAAEAAAAKPRAEIEQEVKNKQLSHLAASQGINPNQVPSASGDKTSADGSKEEQMQALQQEYQAAPNAEARGDIAARLRKLRWS